MEIERTTPTKDNPDGLLFVPEATAIEIGKTRNPGSGAGAVGSVIAGPIVAFVTKGGSKPLPESTTEENAGTHYTPVNLYLLERLKLSADRAKLRSHFTRQFGIRCQSTGNTPNVELTQIIFQTLDASPTNPYVVEFNQFILDPFTGPGQFDLVERDAIRRVFDGASAGGTPVLTSETMNWQPGDAGKFIQVERHPGRFFTILSVEDVDAITLSGDITLPSAELTLTMDGENEVTLATKSGFTDGDTTNGWSRFSKLITVDKVYSVVFVPGDAGDGVFSIKAQALIPVPPDQTPIST